MQLELQMFKAEADDPNVRHLLEILANHGSWLTARQIEHLTQWSERQIRAYAEASEGRIISGQHGYKHTRHATPEEVHHAAAWLEAQAAKMATRAAAIRKRAHQLVG